MNDNITIITGLILGIIIDEIINYFLRLRINKKISKLFKEINKIASNLHQSISNVNNTINKLLELQLQQEYLRKDKEITQKRQRTNTKKQVIKEQTKNDEPEQSKKINKLLGVK